MTFELNKPFKTDQPDVEVDAGLRPGAYHFQLIVINDRGQRSKPTEAVVTIANRIVPPIVVTPGRPVVPVIPIRDRPTPP